MGPAAHTPASGLLEHCPHCGGAVRPGAPWCTQCWTDLRPAPEPEPEPEPVQAAVTADLAGAPAAVPAPRDGAVGPGWPCTACGEHNGVDRDTCAVCGSSLFALMRQGEKPLLVLPLVGDLTKLSRAQRLVLAAVVAGAFCVVIALLSVLLG